MRPLILLKNAGGCPSSRAARSERDACHDVAFGAPAMNNGQCACARAPWNPPMCFRGRAGWGHTPCGRHSFDVESRGVNPGHRGSDREEPH